jgi:photosystem II stability/assembly factor-like uncharacterized protein
VANPKNTVRRALVLPAAILFAGVFPHPTWCATWSEIDSGLPALGVSVNSLVIDPASPSTIYAVAVTGTPPSSTSGLFKSTDAGATWKALSTVVAPGILLIDPKTTSTLYAATNQGIVKSTDGGATWSDAGNGLSGPVSRLVIDPLTPSTLYALSVVPNVSGPGPNIVGTTLFKSTDAGASWNPLDNGPTGLFLNLLVLDPTNPSTIYAIPQPTFTPPPPGGGPPSPPDVNMLKSTDGGLSWTTIKTGFPFPTSIGSLAVDPVNSSVIYVGTTRGVFKSTDGAQSWTALNTGIPANSGITNLTITSTTPPAIYAVVFVPGAPGPNGPAAARRGILKSTDGGGHWTESDIDLPANANLSSLALDPANPSGIYVGVAVLPGGASGPLPPGGAPGVLKTTDGGQSWNPSSNGLGGFDVRTLALNPIDANTLYAGGLGGVFQSSDGGASWNPAGLTAYTGGLVADSVNPNILYAQTGRPSGCGSSERVLLKTTDGGSSWDDSISPQNSGCILSAAFRTGTAAPMVVDPVNSNTVYLAESDDQDGYSALLKSTDGGATWSALWDWFTGLHSGIRALAIDPAHPATLYAGLDDAAPDSTGVVKSTDGGRSWSSLGLASNAVTLLAIDPSNSSALYAGTEGRHTGPKGFEGLFKSTDGGKTWLAINQGLAGVIGTRLTTAVALAINPSHPSILYLGTSNGGVFRSADSGATWTPFNDGLANLQIRALAASKLSPGALYAVTAGGVFTIQDQ